jgi:hypothetical protein
VLSFISIVETFFYINKPQSCHSEERGISLRNLSVMEVLRFRVTKGQRDKG